MNIALGRKYYKRGGPMRALLIKNPVLVLGLDLPFVIVCATTLKTAVALSIEMFLIHLCTMAVALITVRHLPVWLRMLVNVGVAFVVMTFARHLVTLLFPDLSNYVGMYIYLMAVNGITFFESSRLSRRAKPLRVMAGAALSALAFSLTMLLVALFREYFANGTLWGLPVTGPAKLSGLAQPFGGFIIMGFLIAFMKFFNKKMLALSISEAIRRDQHYTEIAADSAETEVPAPPAYSDVRPKKDPD